jgi:myo-inositol-1(or 4)-monophosphatase
MTTANPNWSLILDFGNAHTLHIWMAETWKKELDVAFEAAREASQILTDYFGRLKAVLNKGQEGLVSEADQNSEIAVRQVISKAFPTDSILGEEQGFGAGPQSSSSERRWIIDPLDGTTNYVHRFPFFAVSIGFQAKGQVRLGVVEAPLLGWRFWAVQGQGAYLNGDRIHASQTKSLTDSLLATGFSYSRDPEMVNHQVEVFRLMVAQARGVRRAGAAALDLCMVANGCFDGYWERTLKPWDTAGGSLIAQEAGCIVTDFDGNPYRPERDDVIAATPGIHSQIVDVLKAHKLSNAK